MYEFRIHLNTILLLDHLYGQITLTRCSCKGGRVSLLPYTSFVPLLSVVHLHQRENIRDPMYSIIDSKLSGLADYLCVRLFRNDHRFLSIPQLTPLVNRISNGAYRNCRIYWPPPS